jgi:hypothetical protein
MLQLFLVMKESENDLVGETIMAPTSRFEKGSDRRKIFSRTGTTKASVFPDPVTACRRIIRVFRKIRQTRSEKTEWNALLQQHPYVA